MVKDKKSGIVIDNTAWATNPSSVLNRPLLLFKGDFTQVQHLVCLHLPVFK